jgi:FAD/FMN-containing dehydrogenase
MSRPLLICLFFQIKIVSSCRTPFAVKGGGHATNPGFSSTPGVQIAMSRFNETKVNPYDGTVEVGPGLTWDQVYEALSPTGVNVVGGRIPGVGVAGLTLGGGEYFAFVIGYNIMSGTCRLFI